MTTPTGALYVLRQLLGPAANQEHGQPAPVYWMAAQVGISPGAWGRAERSITDTHGRTLEAILQGLNRIGIRATPNHLWGVEPWPPLPERLAPIPTHAGSE